MEIAMEMPREMEIEIERISEGCGEIWTVSAREVQALLSVPRALRLWKSIQRFLLLLRQQQQ